MISNMNVHSIKPILEHLEDRVQPSFLTAGTVQAQLVPNLNAIFSDMQSAKTDLQVRFTNLHTSPPGYTDALAEADYGKGAADYQRMLNDQHAIQAVVNADIAFIRAAAIAEFSEGDQTDALLVFFGPLIGFNPTSALTAVVTQANNLINGNDVTTWVNTDFFPTTPSGFETHNTFAQEVTTPTF